MNPNFEDILQRLIDEARSHNGVTGNTVRLAMAARPNVQVRLKALERILAELNDDGITEQALVAAEAALAAPLRPDLI